MPDLTDQLRSLGDAALAAPETVEQLRCRNRRRHRRRLAVFVSTLGAFVFAVVGVAVVARSANDGSPGPATAPTAPTTTITAETPSQSADQAERDGVPPDLALVPLEIRADIKAAIEVPEGRWAIARGTPALERRVSSGVLVCDCFGYGEVLLLDVDGAIEKAYPMPSFPPTWITVTDRYVYAGRQGDGGLPDSSLVRIDRSTLEAEVLVFRGSTNGQTPVLAEWHVADAAQEAQLESLFSTEPDAAFAPVTSWIDPQLRVDLNAVDALLAATSD